MQVDTLRLLTVDEVARRFRQSRLTIRRKIAAGQLEAVRLGEHGPLRVPEAALTAYLQPASSSERAVGSLAEGGSP
jgi:excisionase family DNA binding protein